MSFPKISPGDSFRNSPANNARWTNAVTDMLNAYKEGRLGRSSSGGSGPKGYEFRIQVKNLSGANLDEGHVVRVGDFLLNEDDRVNKWFEGNAVTTTFSPEFALVTQALVEDAIGPAQCGGIAVAVCDFTPAKGDGCGPKPSQATLAKGFPGCRVLDVVNATDKIAIVQMLTPIATMLGKTTGAVTGGTASTAYRIYGGTFGSEADCGFTTVPSALSRIDIDTDKWIKLTPHNNGVLMEPLECNA